MSTDRPGTDTLHATAVVIGEAGVLIRGVSGAGKSTLAEALIAEAAHRGLFGRLIGDDRIRLSSSGGRLTARPHPALAGLIERRGVGIAAIASEEAVVLRLVADIVATDAPAQPARMPGAEGVFTDISGVHLPRLSLLAAHSAQEQARRVLTAIGY